MIADPDMLQRQAVAHAQAGNHGAAEAAFRQAVALAPGQGRFWSNRGVAARLAGDAARQAASLARAARLAPGDVDLAADAAAALVAADRPAEAARAYDDLLVRAPGHPAARFNLALLRRAAGQLAEAADLLAPLGFREARLQLAAVERQRGRLAAAAAAYRSLIAADAGDADGWAGLGSVLAMGGDDGARPALAKALALLPDAAPWWADLGHLDRAGRPGRAAASYARALALRPGDAIVAHHLAALSGANVDHAPAGYAAGLFDAYAERFDAELVGKLGYRVPEEIAALVAGLGTGLDVADLGCGTGLCAAGLKPHARSLTGVDLSAAMLAQAQRLDVYDRLVQADLVSFLAQHDAAFDLAVAGDVFVYVGALEAVFAGLGRAVRPGGHAAFSVEHDEGSGVALRPSGRFAHGAAHVEAAAAAAGFRQVERRDVVLRQDHGQPIRGRLYLYVKNSD